MNLRVVPQGSLNTLAVVPDLVGDIKTIQHYDSEVEKIKRYLAKGSPHSSLLSMMAPCTSEAT